MRYAFGQDFLEIQTVGLTLNFTILGEDHIKNLVMIERHFVD